MAHLTEWAFERRLHQDISLSTPTPHALGMSSPLYRKRTRRWSTSSRPAFSHSQSSPILSTSHKVYGSAESQTRRPQPSDTIDLFSSRTAAVESQEGTPRVTPLLVRLSSEVTDAVVEEEEIKEERECLSADAIERTRLILGVAYGSASGALSGLCLLFAKTGVELLILTVVGDNQVSLVRRKFVPGENLTISAVWSNRSVADCGSLAGGCCSPSAPSFSPSCGSLAF